MKTKLKVSFLALAVAGILVLVLATQQGPIVSAGGGEKIDATASVHDFQDYGGVIVINAQNRGTSALIRNAEGISMNLETSNLPVGAYSVWWVIFNKPSECTNGTCGAVDTGKGGAPNTAEGPCCGRPAGSSDRTGHLSASLGVGPKKAPGEVRRGPTLTNPMGAEVHVVLRFHGTPAWDDPELFTSQLGTFGGGCDIFACFNPQSVAHLP